MNLTTKNLLLVACVAALVVPAVYVFYLRSARIDRTNEPALACLNNLRQIDAAEQAWGLERKTSTNEVPTWEDLRTYFHSLPPRCPAGGTYSLVRVGDLPTCSVAEHTALYRTNRPTGAPQRK